MGRNIFQSDAPHAIMNAVNRVLHENLSPTEAQKCFQRIGAEGQKQKSILRNVLEPVGKESRFPAPAFEMVERLDGCVIEFLPGEVESGIPDDLPAILLVFGVIDFIGQLTV
jgi:hypothetical protein